MYLDSNGDGRHDTTDRLNPSGVPTLIDIYLWTAMNSDSAIAACDTQDGPLSMNSYVFNLVATGGDVVFESFVNHREEMFVSFGELNSSNSYKNGVGGGTITQPGCYSPGEPHDNCDQRLS